MNPSRSWEDVYTVQTARIAELERELAAFALLLAATNEMMAVLGYHGEISARDDRVQAVMDALHKVDPR